MIADPFRTRALWRVLVLALVFAAAAAAEAAADGLPSWNPGTAKSALVDFVATVTDPASPDYVPPQDRIAVFDNDGTLWSEKPFYFQFLFAMDRLKAMAAADPSILTTDTMKAAAAGDLKGAMAEGMKGLQEIVSVTHAGMSIEAFQAEVAAWLATARHPQTGLAYDAMVYQPMLELLSFLRDNGFATFIVSGGGVDFMRVFADRVYGVPVPNVIGTLGNAEWQVVDGVPAIMKDPGIFFVDDGPGKPLAIARGIGLRPILAFGNSDGDLAMLEWTTAGDGARLGLLVHHTDAAREWAYDRDSPVGKLDKGLDAAAAHGWLLVDMAADWRTVYPDAE